VIDDGSTDGTSEILRELACERIEVIRHESHTRDFMRIPILYNLALQRNQAHIDFLLFTSDDAKYPSDYIESLIEKIRENNKLVVVSGDFAAKELGDRAPQGTGRLVNYPYYRQVGGYPEGLWGWESWLLFKALMDGREIKNFQDIRFQHTRPYSNASIITFGYAMYCLGYSPLMVAGRFLINFLRHYMTFTQNCMMLYGYIKAFVKRYRGADPQFRRTLRYLQHKRILYYLLRLLRIKIKKSRYAWV